MKPVITNLGKVSVTADGFWDINKDYDRLCIVTYNSLSFISRKHTPAGTEITDTDYWQPLGTRPEASTIITTKDIVHKVVKKEENEDGETVETYEYVSLEDIINQLYNGEINGDITNIAEKIKQELVPEGYDLGLIKIGEYIEDGTNTSL